MASLASFRVPRRFIPGAPAEGTPWSAERVWFALAALLAVVAVAVFVSWMRFGFDGDSVTTAVDDLGEAAAALIGAGCCWVGAARSTGQVRRAWALMGASAVAWGLGQVTWSVYEVFLRVPVPIPGLPDVGFLLAMPLAVAAILNFYTADRGTSTRLRLWLDGAIVTLGLLCADWTIGLSSVWNDPEESVLGRLVGISYPIGDILIATLLILAIRRATGQAQGRLLLLLGGLACNAFADTAFAELGEAQANVNSLLYTGWVAGYLMIALAALWPSGGKTRAVDEKPIDLWQLALPWLAVPMAGVAVVALAVKGQPVDQMSAAILVTLTLLLTGSQVFSNREWLTLLMRTRRVATMLENVFESAPLGVVRIATDLTIVQANARFSSLLLASLDAVTGSSIARYFQPEELARIEVLLKSLSEGQLESVESDSEAVRSDGTTVWFHWSATAVRDAEGRTDFFIAMFEDTTAKHDAQVSATANLAVLERLNRLKSEFLTMVGHEFRTALVGIQGFSELIRDQEQPDVEEVKTFAADIYNDAQRLDGMVNKMLAVDHLEADRTILHVTRVELNSAIQATVRSTLVAHPGSVITTALDASAPAVLADPDKLAQVLIILLNNAIRYSPAGGAITVSERVEPGRVVITVKDHGAGMPAEFDDHLFGHYQWQADNPTSTVVGTGLGLPIARQLVEMHGGHIWFESKVGEGSEFHFTMPTYVTGRAAA